MHARGRLLWVAVVVAICATASGAAWASARSVDQAATHAPDRVAVHAYLVDIYVYRQATLANATASKAGLEATVAKLGAECGGVLAGVPQEPRFLTPPEEFKLSARQRGEAKRIGSQLQQLESEAHTVLSQVLSEPNRSAALALAGEIRRLRWHSGALARYMREYATSIEAGIHSEAPPACADMKAWVASGYKTLSPASKAIVEESEREIAELLGGLHKDQFSELLKLFVLPANRALIRKAAQVGRLTRQITGSVVEVDQRLDLALGLASSQQEDEPPEEVTHPHAHSVKIGAGKTAAHTGYTIWAQRKRGAQAHCMSIEIETMSSNSLGTSFGSCVPSSARRPEPSVECEEGLLVIQSQTLPGTRRVVLQLSNGAQIESRPAIVPKRLGGPAGIYYQAVRGPSPIPVSLTELGARGKLLRVVKLSRFIECTKDPVKYLSGGLRTLIRGHIPRGGPRFSILAERYRRYGHIHFELALKRGLEVEGENRAEEESGGGFFGGGEAVRLRRSPFEPQVTNGCHPYEYAIVYGLLIKPHDTVFVKVAGKLEPLKRVGIPASFHTADTLVYTVLTSTPEEVVVRSAAGKTVEAENMRREAREAKETCEGESEGSGPTVGSDNGIL